MLQLTIVLTLCTIFLKEFSITFNMCHIIIYYTETVKIFSLELLNNRKQNFNYGPIDVGNISPIIKLAHIKKVPLENVYERDDDFCFLFLINGR